MGKPDKGQEEACIEVSFSLCPVDVMRNLLQSQVTTFLSVWNKLRRSLETNGECPAPLVFSPRLVRWLGAG